MKNLVKVIEKYQTNEVDNLNIAIGYLEAEIEQGVDKSYSTEDVFNLLKEIAGE